MKRIAAVMAFMALTLPAQAAEIFSEGTKLWLVGEIAKGDADRFVQLLTPEIRHVYVYSRLVSALSSSPGSRQLITIGPLSPGAAAKSLSP